MAKGQLKDLIASTWEDGSQALLESNIAQEAITELGTLVVEEGTAIAIGSIFAGLMPRVNGIRLAYQQKRFERNVKEALAIINDKTTQIDQKMQNLEVEVFEKFRGLYVEWMLDNLHDERQVEKVKYHINGYINMMENSTNDNVMIMFLDTLSELTSLDIDVLKLYSVECDETAWDVLEKYHIKQEQLGVIKEKLVRYGLIYSKLDDARDDNVDAIAKYLIAVEAESKKRTPKQVKMKDIKKPKSTESYSITALGRDFLRRILN